MNDQLQWAAVLSAAASPAVSTAGTHLRTAVQLGLSVAPDAAACSITEFTGSAYRTTWSVNELAVALDEAQYAAGAGPCLTAASRGSMERLDDTQEQGSYPAFGAATVRNGIRSSLSLPLTGLRRPSALNMYATRAGAFAAERPQAVADLLARCVSRLLSGPRPGPAASAADLDAAEATRNRVLRAQSLLMAAGRLNRTEAFTTLTRRSQEQRQSILEIVDDILRNAEHKEV